MKYSPHFHPVATVALRLALAGSFLSAVADRFGLWGPPGAPNVAWGTFEAFTAYTALLLPFLPAAIIPAVGWIATVAEVVLAIGLISGAALRWFAAASALLLLTFALAMTVSLGVEPAFSYSVWTAAAAALLLASSEHAGKAEASDAPIPRDQPSDRR